jgi:hypothetical protein
MGDKGGIAALHADEHGALELTELHSTRRSSRLPRRRGRRPGLAHHLPDSQSESRGLRHHPTAGQTLGEVIKLFPLPRAPSALSLART